MNALVDWFQQPSVMKVIRKYLKYLTYIVPVFIAFFYIVFFKYTYSYAVQAIFPIIALYYVVGHVLIFCFIFNWYKCITADPNDIPITHYQEYGTEDLEYCSVCQHAKYPRVHHCDICGRCIVRFDHHCSWLSCIGLHNHRYFFLTLFYGSILALVHLTVLGLTFYYSKEDAHFYYKTNIVFMVFVFNGAMSLVSQMLIQAVITSFNLTLVETLSVITTYRREKKWVFPYFKSVEKSWRDAFRVPDNKSLWIYFLPFTPSNNLIDNHGDN